MAKKKKHDSVKFNLQLNELGPDDGNPELIVRAVGPKGETLESSSTRSGDSFVLSAKALESAERVEFSAAPEDGGEGTERAVHSVPMAQMLRVAKAD
ncbi:MAG: hypothetical protein GY947_09560, partial [Rhodobacteraceae bacterium]|nr:hypothetical protein [Paracoccaceae bacterium]